jgi:hypothetical protein
MAIESAIFYLVALALPLWLVVEELMHRERRREVEPAPATLPISCAA